ncbi:putative Heavy metal sensor kinase [Herminiimonas arsenicoxydans]|uniref:Sensor protein n=1 Tax=Herminiimonas arsenicoxydans TaxID=204773 RepID=A4G2R8_HERAR|nr:putative Heavy metal sensor kinase [Herminiimonas arsenicoxydans]
MTSSRTSISLTSRVTIVFVAIVIIASTSLGIYLYRSFVKEIERRDDTQLLGKLRQVQQLIENPDTPNIIIERPQYFRDTMSGQENALVRIIGQDGISLLDINPQQENISYPQTTEIMQFPGVNAIANWTSRDGYPGRVVAGMAKLGSTKQPVTIYVARAYAERTDMFSEYRRKIAVSVMLSAALAALMASVMLRRGLKPLRKMARHAALVRPGKLQHQLDDQGAPSELLPLIHAFNAMLGRLQEGYLRLSQFSTDLAHEFRTPVTSLLGQSQVALGRPRSADEYKQLVISNMEELERLSRMIDSMLFLARVEREQMSVARYPLLVQDEFDRLCNFFEDMSDERGLILSNQGDGIVMADAQLLRRALSNLLSNAIRHADKGSTIELRSRQEAEFVVLSVTNTGATIGPEHMPHLFDRFYRADSARTDSSESTGLGLSIVRAIMTLHHGRATVTSQDKITHLELYFPTS